MAVKTAPKALIFGYIGEKNAGDDLILLATLNNLRAEGARVTALSSNPRLTEKMFKVRAVQARKLLPVLRELITCDLLVCGGGGIFQDKTSVRSVLYYSLLVLAARVLSKEIRLLYQGVGPLTTRIGRSFTRAAFNSAGRISVRDIESWKALKELGVKAANIPVAGDAVQTLRFFSKRRNAKIKTVVFALRECRDFALHIEDVVSVSKSLKKAGVICRFVPFQAPQDNLTGLERGGGWDYRKIIREISSADVVAGSRYHSLILADMFGIPFIGINHDAKIENFCALRKAPLLSLSGNDFKERLESCIMKALMKQ